ncbi:MAG TPA: PKD domain-containing protein [Chitinophagaceae bacterium]|nr:PKD domain-containing protein [Chitinophagaceae bacterium]
MKQAVSLFLIFIVINSCSKDNGSPVRTNDQISAKAVAQFKIDLTMGDGVKEGDLINFENQSTKGLSYFWEFGDGSTSTEINPSHTYSCGTVSVKLTAIGKNGEIITAKQDLLIYCAGRGVHGG